MANVRVNVAARVLCVIVFALGCGGTQRDHKGESAGAHTMADALPEASPAVLVAQPGTVCDPSHDGWMPAEVPLSAEDQAKKDRGEPSVINYPEGYQSRAPKAVPYCVPDPQGRDAGTWAIDCAADDDCPAPARCTVFGDCVAPCTSDVDCEAPKRCLQGPAEGLKVCRDLELADDAGPACGACRGGTCCGAECVGLYVDPKHCGSCDHECPADQPICNAGKCEAPSCDTTCDGGQCCGSSCCADGEQCCRNSREGTYVDYCYPADKECPPPCLDCM
jgi:hypothetical protein